MAVETLVERLHAALELAETGRQLMRQNLLRAHPEATPSEIDGLLSAWLDGRTGADGGDCPGPRRTLRGS